MTISIRQALARAAELRGVSPSWRLDAELLLAHALGKRRDHLYTWPEEPLSASKLQCFADSMARRKTGEPVAYIIGRKAFRDFEVAVNPAVLIPRPETELLVEVALQLAGAARGLELADLGTGSGVVAIALARNDPSWRITAVDVSEAALAVARRNAAALKLSSITFRRGSWCDGLAPQPCDMILANPPYVAPDDAHLLHDGLPFEPRTALVAADSGQRELRTIIRQARGCLKRGGWLLLEHGRDQRDELTALLHTAGYARVRSHRDCAGLDRVLVACRSH